MVINNGNNDDNKGNRNDIVFYDGYSNICVADPATGDPRYKQWKSENSLIIAWLVSSMEIGIGKFYMFLPSAKDVWEAVKETYFNIQNSSQIFGLKSKLWHAKQEDSVLFLKRQENDRVFMFLVGLNKDLDEVRGRVLGKVPLPTLREIFVEIRKEEARNLDEGRRSDKVPWCDHCKREWHTRETCWKLKGKPPNWKKKSGCTFQTSNSDQGQQLPPSQFPLTTEQLDRLYKLLESPNPSCSISIKGNSTFLSVSLNHTWIVDSGASDHITGESTLFS
ncbi:hypothetical protein KIW84_040831 [Lathyrus oleraceus]|uniref:Retrotransposon Copia-like N-terminal domain-containing protein n=1 Tax=Pisum sativum TaxID=3888 RepID=A0A9D5AQQ1_PEA|nr:hypothetical protein KIW84_040831 [Pisum sativum]